MARTELGDIIDELVTLERQLTGSKVAYDEAPESIATAPAWLNFPMRGTFRAQTGWSEDSHTMGCACVKRRALMAQDEALMRPLITQFPDLLHQNLMLNGTVAHIQDIRYQYGVIETLSSPEEPMWGVMFEVDFIVKDVITVDT